MEEMKLLHALKNGGFRPKDLERLANSPELIAELRKQVRKPFETDVQTAQGIMGKNFLGPAEVKKQFGIDYTAQEMEKLIWVPFSKTTLEECKETHILFCGANVTLEILAKKLPESFSGGNPPWYVAERQKFFLQEPLKVRWYLIKKEVEPLFLNQELGSRRWDWLEIKREIETSRKDEEIGFAILYAYAALLLFKARGEKIFKNPLYKSSAGCNLYEEFAWVWSSSQATGGLLTQNLMGEWVTKSVSGIAVWGMVRMAMNRLNQISFTKSEKDLSYSETSVLVIRKPDDPED